MEENPPKFTRHGPPEGIEGHDERLSKSVWGSKSLHFTVGSLKRLTVKEFKLGYQFLRSKRQPNILKKTTFRRNLQNKKALATKKFQSPLVSLLCYFSSVFVHFVKFITERKLAFLILSGKMTSCLNFSGFLSKIRGGRLNFMQIAAFSPQQCTVLLPAYILNVQ
jgi:hypothetical protein